MPLRRGRVGRPGLLGTVARTAVVAGTATATSNAVNNRARRRGAEQQAYAEQQQAYAQQPAAPAYAAPAPPAAPEPEDMVSKLATLSQLHSSGALSDAEFAAAKAQLLG
ncbi:SHOCT domain-containing protein [Nocardia sp. NPDC058176]|uniref:SHOCT domain-containing protein n=1 Tax=Nocardia sp. NPDC058176 TaxID=3346368 RepID=UPI0036DBB089